MAHERKKGGARKDKKRERMKEAGRLGGTPWRSPLSLRPIRKIFRLTSRDRRMIITGSETAPKVKIPDACDFFGIEAIDLYDFLEREGPI